MSFSPTASSQHRSRRTLTTTGGRQSQSTRRSRSSETLQETFHCRSHLMTAQICTSSREISRSWCPQETQRSAVQTLLSHRRWVKTFRRSLFVFWTVVFWSTFISWELIHLGQGQNRLYQPKSEMLSQRHKSQAPAPVILPYIYVYHRWNRSKQEKNFCAACQLTGWLFTSHQQRIFYCFFDRKGKMWIKRQISHLLRLYLTTKRGGFQKKKKDKSNCFQTGRLITSPE